MSSIVRALDTSHDWIFGKSKSDYKTGINSIAQAIKTRLLSLTGDCFFDAQAGIDWFNLLGSKRRLELEIAISTTILNTPDVTGLIELNISLGAARQLSIIYTASTSLGFVSGTVIQGF